MKLSALLAVPLLSSFLPFAALAQGHRGPDYKRHHEIAKRSSGDMQLHKRFSNARFTYFAVGLGACGRYNVPSDFIVALNAAQFGGGYPGPNCFKSITISFGGKSAQATIMDQCPGCPYGGLDLSVGLFRYFSDLSAGVIHGEWHFNGGGGSPPPQTRKASPTPTPAYTPPTTTRRRTTTTTRDDPTTRDDRTTTSTSTTRSRTSTDDSTTSTSSTVNIAAGGIAVPTGTVPAPSAGDPQNLEGMSEVVLNIADLIKTGSTV